MRRMRPVEPSRVTTPVRLTRAGCAVAKYANVVLVGGRGEEVLVGAARRGAPARLLHDRPARSRRLRRTRRAPGGHGRHEEAVGRGQPLEGARERLVDGDRPDAARAARSHLHRPQLDAVVGVVGEGDAAPVGRELDVADAGVRGQAGYGAGRPGGVGRADAQAGGAAGAARAVGAGVHAQAREAKLRHRQLGDGRRVRLVEDEHRRAGRRDDDPRRAGRVDQAREFGRGHPVATLGIADADRPLDGRRRRVDGVGVRVGCASAPAGTDARPTAASATAAAARRGRKRRRSVIGGRGWRWGHAGGCASLPRSFTDCTRLRHAEHPKRNTSPPLGRPRGHWTFKYVAYGNDGLRTARVPSPHASARTQRRHHGGRYSDRANMGAHATSTSHPSNPVSVCERARCRERPLSVQKRGIGASRSEHLETSPHPTAEPDAGRPVQNQEIHEIV